MGDGIQIVGSRPDPGQVWISSNIIGSSARFGLFVSDSEGYIDGNMYIDNGTGDADALVIYPDASTLQGGDVDAAAVSEASPPTIDRETQLSFF